MIEALVRLGTALYLHGVGGVVAWILMSAAASLAVLLVFRACGAILRKLFT